MNVIEMLEKNLRENGFDGLVHEDGECACQIGDLVPCESYFATCRPGYKTACRCGMGCDFHITETRLTQRAPDTCPECGGKKKMLDSAGYPVNCHVCAGTGKRR